jgi:phospholipase/carboxylesterase
MSEAELGFIHRFVPGATAGLPPVLLLHGTGGDESDLLTLGPLIAPGAALLSPRGKVLEGPMPRFFRRLANGVWDVDDLIQRTDELAGFVAQAHDAYKIAKPVAVGYSNGANVAWSLMLRRPDLLAGAVLMRASMPLDPPSLPIIAGIPVLILSGASDPMSQPDQRDRLAAVLKKAGADVTHEIVPSGHGLTHRDIDLARQWFAARF